VYYSLVNEELVSNGKIPVGSATKRTSFKLANPLQKIKGGNGSFIKLAS
jgi:hypothetical protein